MQPSAPIIDIKRIDEMSMMFGYDVTAALLQEFVTMLQTTRSQLDEQPGKTAESLKFLAIKLRGTACEYGASRLVETARLIERSVLVGSEDLVDWRLRLKAEIDATVKIYEDQIIRFQPDHGLSFDASVA